MRRADRLFQLVQILRNKRLVTARELAERLAVSERTIYRDMQDLSLSGVPLEGEAGVGYRLRYSLDIPPLMFSATEIEALVLGARMLRAWGGTELGHSADSLLDKVYAAIPEELRHHLTNNHLFVLRFGERTDISKTLDIARNAIDQRRYVELHYERQDGELSQRVVKPLGLFFWGQTWTLASWCELRNEFRSFRLDRMQHIQVQAECYTDVAGQTLQDYFAAQRHFD